MISFEDMKEEEFEEYFEGSKHRYIEDLSYNSDLFFQLTGKQPKEFAEAQFKEFFTNGKNTPNNQFLKAIQIERNERIGTVWFIHRLEKNISFIGDIIINEKHRRNGYATQILKKLEDIAINEHKTDKIGLNVFKHNPGAKKLYDKLGYEVVSESPLNWDMIKTLK